MSGKAYTMREMKQIVDYLVERKAYGDTRGRKMWMDFANSNVTQRTWQSLKETFLKRILTDIHNPYYKLTLDQIRSFQQGCDVVAKEQNKLEIIRLSEGSSNNADNQGDNEKPSTSNNNVEDKITGEDIKSSKISSRNRSSADTLVLENCYETAADIQKDLESPKGNDNNENDDKEKEDDRKSIRDFIMYSEPLTPMLQEVLHDFETDSDSSGREPRMEIAEDVIQDNVENTNNTEEIPDSENVENNENVTSNTITKEPPTEIADSENKTKSNELKEPQVDPDKAKTDNPVSDQTNSVRTEKINNNDVDDNEHDSDCEMLLDTSEISKEVAKPTDSRVQDKSSLTNNDKSIQNMSNDTPDSLLPNNPEELTHHVKPTENMESSNTQTSPIKSEINGKSRELKRKRANSLDANKSTSQKFKKSKNGRFVKMSKSDTGSPVKKKKDNLGFPENNVSENKLKDVTEKNIEKPVTNELQEVQESSESKKSEEADLKATNVNVDKDSEEKNIPTEIVMSDTDRNDTNSSSQIVNPCLQSVSLYAEQFNKTKYSETDSSEVEEVFKRDDENKQNDTAKSSNNIVVLKSHSESESDPKVSKRRSPNRIVHKIKRSPDSVLNKTKRDKALANVFGFSSGALAHRKRSISFRNRSNSHRHSQNINDYDSSEWTSESEDEFVSPPRGRRNRYGRKYLKPKSARILSLEEEGGLFVMYGKRIYPLVKDGKMMKNYLSYSPESDSDSKEQSYWKLKYVEEKKKTEELKKLLDKAKESVKEVLQEAVVPNSPILQKNSLPSSTVQNPQPKQIEQRKDVTRPDITLPEPDENKEEKTLKIKFTKNNEEVQLEGHWTHIHPVLAQVVQIFQKDSEPSVNGAKSEVDAREQAVELSSGKTTPIIPPVADIDTHQKVDKIEEEIFKEIEELDKEEKPETVATNNVTKRRPGRPRTLTTPAQSPVKTLRSNNKVETPEKDKLQVNEGENSSASSTSKLRSRTPKLQLNESPKNEVKPEQQRRSRSKMANESTENGADESDVRYMFPPAGRSQRKRSASNTKQQKTSKR